MVKHVSRKSYVDLLKIGCAGWGLSSRVAADFPSGGSHLQRYSAVFDCVEIDSSFYRPHRPVTYARWRESVPEHFRFAVKLPRTITHERKLGGIDDLLAAFMEQVGELKDKLGCLLVQLPPSLAFDAPVADAFFASLRGEARCALACEPRHATWFTDEAAALMAQHRVGCVRADPLPVAGVQPRGHASLLYVRLHGSPVLYRSAYEAGYLADLAAELGSAGRAGADKWVIFDNTAQGEAVPNALELRRLTVNLA